MMRLAGWIYVGMLVYLKASGQITWSWWLVLAPLWGFALLSFGIGFVRGFRKSFRRAKQRPDTPPPRANTNGTASVH